MIRVAADGVLRAQNEKDHIHAIIEVKPFAITMDAEKILMQIAIEM